MTDSSQEHTQPVVEKKMQDFLVVSYSLQALQRIHAVPNCCFDNAWKTFRSFPDTFRHGRFVEGWIVFDMEHEVVLNEHGWCELADGRIVDPSILLLVDPEQPVYYFLGVTRSWEDIEALLREDEGKDILLPHVRFDGKYGADGLGHPSYRAAHEAARHKVLQLAQAADPPKQPVFFTAQEMLDEPGGMDLHVAIYVVPPDQPKEDPHA